MDSPHFCCATLISSRGLTSGPDNLEQSNLSYDTTCEGHVKASQYLSSIGLSHYQPVNTSFNAYPLGTQPSIAILPGWPMPILHRPWLLPASTSLPLGTDTEASLSPALKCQPKGVPNQLTWFQLTNPFFESIHLLPNIAVIRLECN